MPFKTNENKNPYFNDFDETKNFQQILFRPSVAVQARELTQLQSILQNQIERFGNWAFQNGDIVQGCSITDVPIVPYVFLSDADASSNTYDARTFVNCVAISAASNLQARVLYANVGFAANYPNTNIIYLNYMNTGTGGEIVFSNNELIQFYTVNNGVKTLITNNANVYTLANVAGTNTVGQAHGISVSEGIVYINGAFVRVENSTFGLVNAYGVAAGNNVVGFTTIENIITENQDSSLYDNALGYPNYSAPGAHRLQVIPALISVDPTTLTGNSNFNPIAVYNFGSLVQKSTQNELHSTISKAVSKSVYDEAGNFVLNPFAVDTVTNISSGSLPTLSGNGVYGRINPGSGYAQGQYVEILKTAYINMRRGVDTQVNREQQITFNYNSYYVVDEVAGTFPFNQAQKVYLYDTPQQAITNRTFSSLTPSGNNIGTAQLKCFTYNSGTPGTNTATYIINVFNVRMANGYNTNQVMSLYSNSSGIGVADVYSNGIVGGISSQLFSFGVNGIKSLLDSSNNNNTQYEYRTTQSTTMYANGVIVVNLPSSATGGTDILPYGLGTLPSLDAATFNVIASANVDSTALPGTVTVTSTSSNVSGDFGSGTTFTTSFAVGDQIKVGSTIRTVNNIVNSSFLQVDSVWGINASTNAYYKSILAGKLIPIQSNLNGSGGYITITNTTSGYCSFTINTGLTLQSNKNVNVVYDVLRTTVKPAKKIINKNRFVCINTAANPLGPWCLGFSDIHQVKAIYGSSTGFSTGTDITKQFTYDTGQKDSYYDLGYLYPTGGYSQSTYPNLVVQLDYFTTNTAPGVGFYTVESYPIQDDPTLANNSTIYTKDVPLYVDSLGTQRYLRDYVDFRVTSLSTATDTGNIDVSNTSQVTTAIGLSSVNPSNTITFNVPSSGLNVPSYGKNFQADYTMYLSRKDLIYISPDGSIKVKEGLSSITPQQPLFPDNAMAINILNIPPFPSLSSDQLDSDRTINQLSKNLIRDTSTAITGSSVSNRVYKMSDIGKLDQRITNLEYYASLSLLESQATNITVTDANGLNRFKNGIFVDPFNDFGYADVSNPEFSIAIDSGKGIARPKFSRELVYLKFNSSSSSNVQKTGRCITLPYTEVSFLNQPFATKYRSAAHVASHWNGTMILFPSFDNNIDTSNTASASITINNATPWQQFASSPFGSVWGPWQTTRAVTTRSVVTGTASVTNLNLGYLGTNGVGNGSPPPSFIVDRVNQVAAQYAAQGYQIGSTSTLFTTNGGLRATTSSNTYAAPSDTSSTIIVPGGNVPNYTNIGPGYPIYQG